MKSEMIITFFLLPLFVAALIRGIGQSKKAVNILLSFSGAFLLAIALVHILPELYLTRGTGIGFWLLGGFLLQVVLEFLSKGIEHGHVHLPSSGRLPLLVLMSLCLHSFIEGMPFAGFLVDGVQDIAHEHAHSSGHEHKELFGLPLFLAVLLHKIPVAVALGGVLMDSTANVKRYWAYFLLFAISFPLGAILGPYMTGSQEMIISLLALSMGMLLHISMTIIFESSKEHRIVPLRFAAMVLGMATALFFVV